MHFQGIQTPVITPFHDDFSINDKGFVEMIEFLIDSGVHEILVGGTTGQYYAETLEERVHLFKLAKKTIKGRVPMIAGVGALRTEDAIALAEAAKDVKADGMLIGAPYYACPTQKEIAIHILSAVRAGGLPTILYNLPSMTASSMEAPFLDRVCRDPNVVAIKECSGDMNMIHMLVRDYPQIQLICGMDDQVLEFFGWGATSWISAASNATAREQVAFYDAFVKEKNLEKARNIVLALIPVLKQLEQGGALIQSVKHCCDLQGLPAGKSRRPLLDLHEEEKRKLKIILRTAQLTVADILRQDREG